MPRATRNVHFESEVPRSLATVRRHCSLSKVVILALELSCAAGRNSERHALYDVVP